MGIINTRRNTGAAEGGKRRQQLDGPANELDSEKKGK